MLPASSNIARNVFVAFFSVSALVPASGSAVLRPVSELAIKDRLHAPDGTQVIVKGRAVTLGEIRSVHAARLEMARHATDLGRRIAGLIRSEHLALTPAGELVSVTGAREPGMREPRTMMMRPAIPVGRANGLLGGAGNSTPAPIRRVPVALSSGSLTWLIRPPIAMPQSVLQRFAKDYQDFCTAAQATACLYFPVIGTWEQSNSASNTQLGAPTQDIVDPLVTDANVCREGGGSEQQDGCHYTYPMIETTNFAPSASTPFVENCPVDPQALSWQSAPQWVEWAVTVDPHGAASAKYGLNTTWPPWLYPGLQGYNGGQPSSCVVQVFQSS